MSASAFSYLSSLSAFTPQPIYLVGGSVRDLLIGTKNIKDIDILIPSGSEVAARNFADEIGGSFFFLDEERKMTRVVKREGGETLQFDFADFIGNDLQSDLSRRDFTLNAMALDLREYPGADFPDKTPDKVIDPFGGREDIKKKTIRVVRADALDDDPLRMLRAVRFSGQLDYTIENKTAEHIRDRAGLVARPSPERIRDELFQILSLRGAAKHLFLMDSLDLLRPLFPELGPLRGFAPGKYHTFDVLTHSIKVAGYVDEVLAGLPESSPAYAQTVIAHLEEALEQLIPRKAALRFACLLHDIAKPETFSDEGGHVRFHGHEALGAERAKETCRRFRLSRGAESLVVKIIKQHMRLFQLATPGGPSRHALFRYCRDLGDDLPESLILALADSRSTFEIMPADKFTGTEKLAPDVLDYYYGTFLKTEEKPFITGHDLIARGFSPGPRFREILDDIRERQAEGSLTSREKALDYLDALK